jgi:hypothetical protein
MDSIAAGEKGQSELPVVSCQWPVKKKLVAFFSALATGN